MSPEVLDPNHKSYSGKASDAWSLGIVLFTLLLGRYPFHHQTITTMFAKIARGKFQIPPSTGLSVDAKILLRSLIRLKPEERLLPDEILAHNWLKQVDTTYILKHYDFKYSSTSASNFLANNVYVGQTNHAVHKPLGISLSAPAGRTTNNSPSFNPFLNAASSASSLFPTDKRDFTLDRFVPVFETQQ